MFAEIDITTNLKLSGIYRTFPTVSQEKIDNFEILLASVFVARYCR